MQKQREGRKKKEKKDERLTLKHVKKPNPELMKALKEELSLIDNIR